MKTLEQEFAGLVYSRVKAYADRYPEDSPERKGYGGTALKLPILIRSAGLTQALAFVDSRGKPPQLALLEDLAQVAAGCNMDQYLEKSRSDESQAYLYLTRKTMLALKWFKRFAQSVLGVEATEVGEKS